MADPNARPPLRQHPHYQSALKIVVAACAVYFAARFFGYL
jgi:hypothetical protein